MPHTVELLLDAGLEAEATAAWDLLLAAGLPSQARHPHPSNRPHLTLAVPERLGPAERAAVEAELAALPVPLRLDGLVVLGGRRRAVAWLVVPGAPLLDLHRRVHAALGALGALGAGEPASPLLLPDRWVPHVTLAARTTPERAGAVVAALSASGSPPPAQGTADRARSHDTMARTTSWLHPAGPPGPAPLA